MQTLFQKVSKTVGNMVGGNESAKVGDEILQDCKQRLDELEQQVTSVRSQFATYAEQMMQSCEASVLLSKSVSDFYRSANNSARSESVRVYEEVQDNAANNAVAIYQRQLQMEDGVISELDQWLQIVARVNEQIEEADRLRQAAETASARLQTLQNKVDSRKTGGIFAGDGTDLQNRIEETERAQKNFEADFESARNEVRENVQRIMQKRFTMFDRVYVQILECQVQFFERASKDVDGFRRSIRNYRRKFPRDSGSTMHSSLSHGISRTSSEPKRDGSDSPTKRPPRNASVPVEASASGSELTRGETDFIGDFMGMPAGSGNANGNDSIENSVGDSHESGDMFGEFVSAPQSSGPVAHSTSAPPEMEEQKRQQRPPGPKRQVSDMFGLNLFGTTPHGHSDTELDYPSHPHQLSSNPRGSRSSVDLGAMAPGHRGPSASEMFDEDFWATNTPTAASSAPVSNNANLMEDFDIGQPSSATRPPPAATIPDEKSEAPHLMAQGPPSAAGRGAGVLNMGGADKRREFVRKLQEEERKNHENREQAQDAVEARLRGWEYKGDVRRNLRSLLTSMDRVLWEGAKWKPLQMSELLNHDKIAKKYKKALNAVHPDKISLVRGFTPEQIAIAEGVFMALTEAWLEYEKSQ